MANSGSHRRVKKDTPLNMKHARALRAVFAINAVMSVVEGATGYLAHSTAILADSMDMLTDALGAAGGLLVRKSSPRKQAWVALAKAGGMAALGLGVLGGATFLFLNPVMPVVATMGIVGGLALAANATCGFLLYRYRNDDINMNSTWRSTRNDMISNLGVLAAAAASHLLASPLPDIIVGAVVSGWLVKSAVGVARDAIKILRATGKGQMEKTTAPAKAPEKEPEPVHGFKKVLHTVFGRAAKPPRAAAATATPAAGNRPRSPVRQTLLNSSLAM